jgi:AraC-like DNA-binding protein
MLIGVTMPARQPLRQTTHAELDSDAWTLTSAVPAAQLRGDILRYAGYQEATAQPVRRRELPAPTVTAIVNLGSPWRLGDARAPMLVERPGSFVAGLDDVYAISESSGLAHCLQIDLTPLGARRLFGQPMDALARRVIDLGDLLGADGRHLEERLVEAPGWERRFHLLDDLIGHRLADAPPSDPGVRWAWRQLRDAGGHVEIGDLTAELGWSRKRLAARFRDQVGLPPKTVAQLFRFRRALPLLRRGTASGAEIAHRCGYADQAHLVRAIRRFSGHAPGELRSGPEPDHDRAG